MLAHRQQVGTVTSVTTDPILVQTDSRGRVAIGKLSHATSYLAWADPAGRVVLEPAVIRTEVEDRLLRDPEFITRMTKAASEPASPLDLDDL